MWIPQFLYARLPLLYAGAAVLSLAVLGSTGVLSAAMFACAATLTYYWRRD